MQNVLRGKAIEHPGLMVAAISELPIGIGVREIPLKTEDPTLRRLMVVVTDPLMVLPALAEEAIRIRETPRIDLGMRVFLMMSRRSHIYW